MSVQPSPPADTIWRRPLLALPMAAVALFALLLPLWVVTHPAPIPQHRHHRLPPVIHHILPQAEVPSVEPVEFADMSPDVARAYNGTIPFVTGPIPPARPFRIAGTIDSIARATDCLATAELYEAGDDAQGEEAVAQVVLNRLRHPAFPKTVCGVVFEGAERSTGCQFTFTCDGAMQRWTPSAVAWDRARDIATRALHGFVFKPVGYATHYHTDWVVPYWRASLDKIAAIHTHLFYRWTGWWGTAPAFNRHVTPDEPLIPALATLSAAHRPIGTPDPAPTDTPDAQPFSAELAAAGGAITVRKPEENSFLVTIPATLVPELFPAFAAQQCGGRPVCRLMAWRTREATPSTLPLDPTQISTMAFSYLRDLPHGVDKPLWNCLYYRRMNSSQCMKRQVLFSISPVPATSASPAATAASQARPLPDGLSGVRRKNDAALATGADTDRQPTPRATSSAPSSPASVSAAGTQKSAAPARSPTP